MNIWTSELKDLDRLFQSIKGQHPKLDNELSRLLKTDDENMALVYARRCLEVIITELCERELNRKRGSDPLQGIIDRLNREEKVPHHIIVSMRNLNSLSNFGAHPKEFDPQQVKPALLDLNTILRWYMTYIEKVRGTTGNEGKTAAGAAATLPGRSRQRLGKRILLPAFAIVVVAVALIILVKFVPDSDLGKSQPVSIEALAVLPFDNYTGDDQLDYVAAGLHASLIGDLGKVGALRVSGKTSSSAFRDSNLQASEIAGRLGVDALVEPSVLCYGDSICIQISLVTPFPEERQLWVAEFREDKSQIIRLFNQITKQIAEEIMVQLTPEEERLLSKSRIVDGGAYDSYLKARSFVNDFSKESLFQAIDYLNSAIEKEPDWAPLYAGLADFWLNIQLAGYEPPSVAVPKILENLNKALELDPDIAEAQYLKAMFAQWVEWDWEKSEKAFLKALAVNPSDSWNRMMYAQLLLILQRNEEAEAHIELASGLDPFNDETKLLYAATMVQAGNAEEALPVAEELLSKDSTNMNANQMMESAAFDLGMYDKVIKALRYSLPFPIEENGYEEVVRVYNESGIVTAYEELLKYMEKYAEKNYVSFLDMSSRYISANQPNKAMDWIEKGYEQHDPLFGYIVASGRNFEPLYDNPRFIAICEKANLPMPSAN